MSKKEKILGTVVGLHLVLVVMGAAEVSFQDRGPIGEALYLYGQATGAGHGYGFFTGEINSGLRAEFDVDVDGRMEVARLETGQTREADIRIGNILGVLSRSVEDEPLRRAVAASWAGKVLARYPKATKIKVRMESLPIPPMEAFRSGVRYTWEPFYSAEFQRTPKKTRVVQ